MRITYINNLKGFCPFCYIMEMIGGDPVKKKLLILLILFLLISGCSKKKEKEKEEEIKTDNLPSETVKEPEESGEEYVYFPDTYYSYMYSYDIAEEEKDELVLFNRKYVFEEDGTGVEVIFDGSCIYEADGSCKVNEGDPIVILQFTYALQEDKLSIEFVNSQEKLEFYTRGKEFVNQSETNILSTAKNTKDITYTLKPQIYSVIYDLNGGENNAYNPSRYMVGDYIYLYAPMKDGYEFVGWTGSNGDFPQLEVSGIAESKGGLEYIANWSESSSNVDASAYFMTLTYDNMSSLEELNRNLAFLFKVPSKINNSDSIEYRLYSNGMAEAIYYKNQEEVAVIREAITAVKLSNIHASYENEETIVYDDYYQFPYEKVVDVRGTADKTMVADWGVGNNRYSLYVRDGVKEDELIRILDIVNHSNVEKEEAEKEVHYNKVYYSTIKGGFMWSENQVALIIGVDDTLLIGVIDSDSYLYAGRIEQTEDHLYRFYGSREITYDEMGGAIVSVENGETEGYIQYNSDGSISILNKDKEPYYKKEAWNICRYMNGE